MPRAVAAMIFCHPVIRLGIQHAGYESEFAFFFEYGILGGYPKLFCRPEHHLAVMQVRLDGEKNTLLSMPGVQ